MAVFTGDDRLKAKNDALRRAMGLDPVVEQPQKGTTKKKMQLGIRKRSRESRQEQIS